MDFEALCVRGGLFVKENSWLLKQELSCSTQYTSSPDSTRVLHAFSDGSGTTSLFWSTIRGRPLQSCILRWETFGVPSEIHALSIRGVPRVVLSFFILDRGSNSMLNIPWESNNGVSAKVLNLSETPRWCGMTTTVIQGVSRRQAPGEL